MTVDIQTNQKMMAWRCQDLETAVQEPCRSAIVVRTCVAELLTDILQQDNHCAKQAAFWQVADLSDLVVDLVE